MSALGQKQTSRPEISMSALPPKADIRRRASDVRFVPKADIRRRFSQRKAPAFELKRRGPRPRVRWDQF
jgi:hypothetical protein